MYTNLLFYWLLIGFTSSSIAAPPSGPINRSTVDLHSKTQHAASADIANIISRFESTLSGEPVSVPTSGRSRSTNAIPSSALTALLEILDRLQDVNHRHATTAAEPISTSVADELTTSTVDPAITEGVENVTLPPKVQPVVNEEIIPLKIKNETEIEPLIMSNVSSSVFNLSRDDDVTTSSPVVNSTEALEREIEESTTNETLTGGEQLDSLNATAEQLEDAPVSNGTTSLNETGIVGEKASLEDDPSAENIDERYEMFRPSDELLKGFTNPPEYQYVESTDNELEIIGEPKMSVLSDVDKANVSAQAAIDGPFEATTLSGEEFLSAKPFLEGLVNGSTLAEDDLSTVASIAISQSSIAASTSFSEDDPGFVSNRNGPQLGRHRMCTFNSMTYVSGQNIEQDDPCHFCVCVDGDISCYWKNCPPAPEGCADLEFDSVCQRSLYLCPIPVKGQPLPFALGNVKKEQKSETTISLNMTCNILGVEYKVGELVGVASDPCLECRCALDSLYCSPKCCFQPSSDPQQLISPSDLQDPSKNARAEDPVWYPVLANPLMHLRSEFEAEN